jgi:hypothetical protein
VPIRLSLQLNRDYLRFEVTGTRVPGEFGVEMLKVWERVADECKARSVKRVLGISKLTGPVPISELYDIGKQAPPMIARAGCERVGYVVLGGDEALRAMKFGEDVAVNRGQTTRVFADEPSAIAWLMAP